MVVQGSVKAGALTAAAAGFKKLADENDRKKKEAESKED